MQAMQPVYHNPQYVQQQAQVGYHSAGMYQQAGMMQQQPQQPMQNYGVPYSNMPQPYGMKRPQNMGQNSYGKRARR